VVPGEILTFAGGQQCEVITVEADTGAAGELSVRWITFLDTLLFPDDNDAFTGDIAGDGVLDGLVHQRAYSPLNLHRFLADLSDDRSVEVGGDDVRAIYKTTVSRRQTDQILNLVGGATITDEVSQHAFGGSVSQAGGATLYSGLAIQITDADASSEPVVIQDDAVVSPAYWANAFMPNSIAGRVRVLRQTRTNNVAIDGGRVIAKLLEYSDTYFVGDTVLGTGETGVAVFSSSDGNNQTAVGTVAGAPYNTVIFTEGYQLLDFNNGNGPRPFGLSADFGSASSPQTYERTKYVQRRGTAETAFGRDAQLLTGFTLDFSYDTEAGGPFSEDEEVAWGTELPYTGEAGGPFQVGEVVVGGTSSARGRVIYLDDQGTTGTILVQGSSGSFSNTETITGQTSSATATTGTVVNNANAGTMRLYALDDAGATGNLYGQRTRGVAPANNQQVYGATSLATALVDGTANSRVVNTQFVGGYTGSAFNPGAFGVAIDPSDAIAADLFFDLTGATQQPPNNQQGIVTQGVIGDYLAVYPWDGATLDTNGDPSPTVDEMLLAVALVAGVTATVDVGAGNIPANTPAAGFLRVERDSDSEYDLLEYTSHDGDAVFTLGGSTPTAPSAAAIGNNVFRALVDKIWTATGTPESYTAVQTSTNQVAIILQRGGVSPIVPFRGSATFGAAGFTAAVQRISDE